MIINEEGFGYAHKLTDEQGNPGTPNYAKDPRAGTGGPCFSGWYPSAANWAYPAHAIIDLGFNHQITDIYIYDNTDSGINSVEFSAGAPLNWTSLFVDLLPNDNIWNGHAVNVTTRYLRVTYHGSAAKGFPREVVVYGSPSGTPSPPPPAAAHMAPLMGEFIGVNSYVDDPPGRVAAAGNIREYHNWDWDEGGGFSTYPGYPGNRNGFAPSYAAGGGWDFDIFYQRLKAMGVLVSPVKMQNTRWMVGGDALKLTWKPLSAGATDAENPANYVEHADHMWQFAARYASVAKTPSLLKLNSDATKPYHNLPLSGLNFVNYYENWNEPDKWWGGRGSFFHPFEYAALASADYDGHQGTMGSTKGVKNADPNAKLVMAGIAKPSVDYLRIIKFWVDAKRGGSVPFDVINVHHYSNTAGGQGGGSSTIGVSPEADDLKGKMAKIADFRDRYMPGKEFWVSEFGYDTAASGSTQRAPAIGTFSIEEVQAQWLVRSYLALAAAGVDRAQMFMLRDNDASTNIYATCGLVGPKPGGFVPKISWYYVYSLKNRLRNMRYFGEQASGHSNVRIYKFKKDGSATASAYVVWCPTSNQTAVANYQLSLEGSPTQATLVTLTPGNTNGVASSLPITAGNVSINVSERPVFVLLGTPDPEIELDQKLAVVSVTNESGKGVAGNMIDEQGMVGDPYFGAGLTTFNTAWQTDYSAAYPASVYLDLGQERFVTALCYFDTNGIDNLTVSVGTPEQWTPVATQPTRGYLSWSIVAVQQSTRYVRLSRSGQGAAFSEVVVYGRPMQGEPTETWTSQDIGQVGLAGDASVNGGTFTVRGSGARMWGNTNQFHLVHLPASGDCSITARLISQAGNPTANDQYAKAGVMIMQSPSQTSPYAFMGILQSAAWGAKFYRHAANATYNDQVPVPSIALPYWVRLARQSNTFTASISPNGANWTTVTNLNIMMSSNVYMGLVSTSNTNTTSNIATFDNVTIVP